MKAFLQKLSLPGILLVLAFQVLCTPQLKAQPAIHITIGDYNPTTPGEFVFMPITVTNLPNNVASTSMSLLFDPNVIAYMQDTAVNPAMAGGFLISNCLPGNYLFAWFGLSPLAISGTQQLLTLKFQYLGGSCNLTWDTLSLGQNQYSNINGTVIPAIFVNGTINGGSTFNCSNTITYTLSGPTVSFTGNASGGAGPYDYNWYFGDGSSSTSQNPVHTYAQAGTYTVALATMDSLFCYAVSSTQVQVAMSAVDGCVDLGLPLDTGSVVLYRQNNAGSGFLATDTAWIQQCFNFSGITPGYYLLKAMPADLSAFWFTHLPTYYGNTPYWTDADTVSTWQLTNPYNITLIYAFQPLAGPGNISGVVTSGAKISQSGVPAAGVEVLLTDMNDQVLLITYSDANGEFSFDNLAYGNYKVRAEVTSIPVIPWVVTLSAANPLVDYLHITITPSGITTSVDAHEASSGPVLTAVYPNPASQLLNLEFWSDGNKALNLELRNMLGQVVLLRTNIPLNGTHHLEVPVGDIQPGLYTLRLLVESGDAILTPILIAR